ncbi:carbohydrate ABC transporter permease [Aureimonas pseudogalii]|uniref:Multiple sugar transport system permease protein n=1 Tax=Aureimonas pseudogalii TaxID=1744844 RepID=A0A7W6H915_9HYPH|nr:carbohydrate ABC transporter permease [Aureimonas pseudogalii]MBB4000777.1 multiple sugar transport system permease protein [Aureimonas pseudogalii]
MKGFPMQRRHFLTLVGIALTALYLFPLFWMYVTAFKSGSEIFRYPPTFWPQDPQWNIGRVLSGTRLPLYVGNSLLIACGATAIVVTLGTGCAYVLARWRNLWIDAALFAILMMQVLPPSLMVTPLFVMFSQIGLLDTPRLSVVLAQAAKMLPLYIVLCRASFVQVPRDLEEAALVDGASRPRAYLGIVLPLARNGILIASVLVFLQSFGEYVYARSLIAKDEYQTATVGLQAFMGPNANDWTAVMAYATVYVTPVLLVFVLLQRRIVSGLTAGALK